MAFLTKPDSKLNLWNNVQKTRLVLAYRLTLNIFPKKEEEEENVIQGATVSKN